LRERICGLLQDTLQQLTGSTEENEHLAWDWYMIYSGGHTSKKTTNGRLRRHKDSIKMDFRDTGWEDWRLMQLAQGPMAGSDIRDVQLWILLRQDWLFHECELWGVPTVSTHPISITQLQALFVKGSVHRCYNKGNSYFYKINSLCGSGAHIFQKSKSHLKILGARLVAWSMFLSVDTQILGTTAQNFIIWATWRPEFWHPT